MLRFADVAVEEVSKGVRFQSQIWDWNFSYFGNSFACTNIHTGQCISL